MTIKNIRRLYYPLNESILISMPLSTINKFYEVKYNMCEAPAPNSFFCFFK